jgi:hypothetical protein
MPTDIDVHVGDREQVAPKLRQGRAAQISSYVLLAESGRLERSEFVLLDSFIHGSGPFQYFDRCIDKIVIYEPYILSTSSLYW